MVKNDAAYLPPEITEDILSRLPVKSLLRFTGVCRAWNALVSSNPFIRSHLLHSTSSPSPSPSLLIGDKRHVLRFQDREFRIDTPPEKLEFTTILCSCNGVLLLQGVSKLDLVLWNPSIRKIIRFRFPFRLLYAHLKHGLCYDPATADLKVVVLYWHNYAVYSNKNRSWSKHPVIDDHTNYLIHCSTYSREVACVDGAVYWNAYWNACTDLLCFESDGDKLKTVKKPSELENRYSDFPLITLRGRLCIWFYCGGESVARIWMREDGGGWRELMRFEDVPLPCNLKRPSYVGENEIMVHYGWRRRILVYHPREKTYELFNLPRTEYAEPYDVCSSVDTLLLLDQLPRRSNRKRRHPTC